MGAGGQLVKAYLGEPGDLCFLPGGEGFVYLQVSLSYTVFGSHLCAEYKLPLMRNRGLAAEGGWVVRDALAPAPGSFSRSGLRFLRMGGGWLWAGSGGACRTVRTGGCGLWTTAGPPSGLLNGRVTGPLRWSSDSGRIFCAVEEGGCLRGVAVQVGTGEVTDADAPEAEAYAGGDDCR